MIELEKRPDGDTDVRIYAPCVLRVYDRVDGVVENWPCEAGNGWKMRRSFILSAEEL